MLRVINESLRILRQTAPALLLFLFLSPSLSRPLSPLSISEAPPWEKGRNRWRKGGIQRVRKGWIVVLVREGKEARSEVHRCVETQVEGKVISVYLES